ncbi:hypothetical protein SMICM304S_09487 [Streptomyces microflavus]
MCDRAAGPSSQYVTGEAGPEAAVVRHDDDGSGYRAGAASTSSTRIGAMWFVGSSSTSRSAGRVTSRARASLRCCPMERDATGTPRSSGRNRPRSRSSSAYSSGKPGRPAAKVASRVRRVRQGGQLLREVADPGAAADRPVSGAGSPARTRRRVVFPAPLSPVTSRRAPGSTRRAGRWSRSPTETSSNSTRKPDGVSPARAGRPVKASGSGGAGTGVSASGSRHGRGHRCR